MLRWISKLQLRFCCSFSNIHFILEYGVIPSESLIQTVQNLTICSESFEQNIYRPFGQFSYPTQFCFLHLIFRFYSKTKVESQEIMFMLRKINLYVQIFLRDSVLCLELSHCTLDQVLIVRYRLLPRWKFPLSMGFPFEGFSLQYISCENRLFHRWRFDVLSVALLWSAVVPWKSHLMAPVSELRSVLPFVDNNSS